MKENIDWKKAYPPAPAQFHARVERTLAELEEEPMKKSHIGGMVLAAALIVALAGTAFALTNTWGVLDFVTQSGIEPLKSAEGLIQTDVASAETSQAVLRVREAAYDGEYAYLVIDYEPKAGYIVMRPWNEAERSPEEEGPLSYGEIAARDGKTLVSCEEPELLANGQDVLERYSDEANGDGVTIFALARVEGDAPTLELSAKLGEETARVTVTLTGETAKSWVLTPMGSSEKLLLNEATITPTPLASYLKLRYTVETAASEGVYYATEHGIYAHAQPDCSGMANAQTYTAQEIADMGKQYCPVCVAQAPESDESGFDEAATYYAADKATYAHTQADCSGLEGAKALTGREAIDRGLLPCPVCAGDTAGDTTGDTAGDTTRDTAGVTAGDTTGDATDDATGDTAGDTTRDTASDTAGVTTVGGADLHGLSVANGAVYYDVRLFTADGREMESVSVYGSQRALEQSDGVCQNEYTGTIAPFETMPERVILCFYDEDSVCVASLLCALSEAE